MDEYFLHYTSRQGTQSIEYKGQIEPGLDGYIYLTRDLFPHGKDAVNNLSIVGKPIELVALIPRDAVIEQFIDDVEPFRYLRDYRGRLLVRGGASRFRTARPIPADQIQWMPLLVP